MSTPPSHHGAYLRVDASVGALVERQTAATLADPAYADRSGGTFGVDVRAGASPPDGVVFGFEASYRRLAFARSSVSVINGTPADAGTDLVFLGPMIEWYPSATRGLHFGGGVQGAAQFVSTLDGTYAWTGLAAEAHVGVDVWPRGGAEGAGVELRVLGGSVSAGSTDTAPSVGGYRLLGVELVVSALAF